MLVKVISKPGDAKSSSGVDQRECQKQTLVEGNELWQWTVEIMIIKGSNCF